MMLVLSGAKSSSLRMSHYTLKDPYQVSLSGRLPRPGAHQPDIHRQILQDGHHVGVIKAEQLPAVDLEELVAAVQAAVLAHGAVGQHRPDVVVRVLLFAVDLLDGPLQADAQTAILKKDSSQSHEKSFLKLDTSMELMGIGSCSTLSSKPKTPKRSVIFNSNEQPSLLGKWVTILENFLWSFINCPPSAL